MRVFKGCHVDYLIGVEHGDVGIVILGQQSPITNSQPLCGQAAHLAHGIFQREYAPFPDKMAEYAGEGAVLPRVGCTDSEYGERTV